MVNFSFSPTAYWAANAAQRQAIVWEKGNTDYFPFLSSSLNWAEFHHLVSQTANLLITKGVRTDQVIAYSGTHRLIGLLCYCSAIVIGARILMLNPALSESQRQTILSTYQIDILITDQDFANFQQNQTAYLNSNWDSHRPATLTLTSGSSGMPKAVVHSAQNHLENAEGVCELMQFCQTDSWLLSLPLFHVSGQGIVWRWLVQGATLVVNEQKDQFLLVWIVFRTLHWFLLSCSVIYRLKRKNYRDKEILIRWHCDSQNVSGASAAGRYYVLFRLWNDGNGINYLCG
ncbi:O-succinylbenzoic acid--CoA ligase [Actinobacillus equuli]|nr:O-succinylbenzoic acid--CoA ligase [Actinobacillus equuli]